MKKQGELVEEFELNKTDLCCIAVSRAAESWPFLVVSQSYAPARYGFEPGVLIAPETDVLFIGAGERLLAYRLHRPGRLWEDIANTGFWRWSQHQEVVLLAAELEFAAWSS